MKTWKKHGISSSLTEGLFLFGMGLILNCTPTHAFSLTPMSTSLDVSGPGATRSFQIQNPTTESIAVEATLTHRVMNENGLETQNPDPELKKSFLLYPSQMVLKPGEKRTLRLSWTGERTLARESSYRLIVEQLPVQTEKRDMKKGASIKMLLKYVAAVYVTPPGAKAQVRVNAAHHVGAATQIGAKSQMELTLENTGTAHQAFSGTRVLIRLKSDPSRSVELSPEDIPMLEGQNILAGMTRKFHLPWPKSLPHEPVLVTVETKNK